MGETRTALLLDLVHQALFAADYAALSGLEARLAQEISRPDFTLSAAELRLVRHKALRNATCLLAAGRGIKAARRRLSDIRGASGGLITYDRAGKRAEIGESRNLAQRL